MPEMDLPTYQQSKATQRTSLLISWSWTRVSPLLQYQRATDEREVGVILSKTIILFSFTLFLPDTYFGTDFRLSANATGLLCNSILPVVTLCIVLHIVLVVAKWL